MGSSLSLTRTCMTAAAAVVAAGVLLAQSATAGAAPVPTSTTSSPASSSSAPNHKSPSHKSSSRTAPSRTAPSSTTPSSAAKKSHKDHPAKPAATAPPSPGNYGPPCTTNADKTYPVICLPAGSGEDQPGQVTQGSDIEFDAQVVNNGPAVTDASVVITLPKGLELESDEDDPVFRYDDWYEKDADDEDPTDLTCSAGTTAITCSVGALAQHANILVGIDLEPSSTAVAGSSYGFSVALQPVAPDTYPTTSVDATIQVVEPAHLVVSLTPATLHAVVGQSATITATVHNDGPGDAADTFAIALDVDQNNPSGTHFVITNGTSPPAGGDSGPIPVAAASKIRARLQRAALAHAGAAVSRYALPSLRFWPIGTLASGGTAVIPIKLKAESAGEDSLLFAALSGTDDLACDDGDGDGGDGSSSAPAEPSVTVARNAATTTAPGECQDTVTTLLTATLPTTTSSSVALAASGVSGLDAQIGIAVWALVLGSLLVWVGRRRRTAAGRHQF